jgi:hypothetical protein
MGKEIGEYAVYEKIFRHVGMGRKRVEHPVKHKSHMKMVDVWEIRNDLLAKYRDMEYSQRSKMGQYVRHTLSLPRTTKERRRAKRDECAMEVRKDTICDLGLISRGRSWDKHRKIDATRYRNREDA